MFQVHRYDEAITDFEKAKELAPEQRYSESFVKALQFRALLLAESDQWPKAELDLLKAIKNGAEKTLPARDRALLRLAAGDVPAYRKLCDIMMIGFMGKEKPPTTNPVLWTCILAPNTFSDYGRLLELAEDGADNEPRSWIYQNTLGAVLCRCCASSLCICREPCRAPGNRRWQNCKANLFRLRIRKGLRLPRTQFLYKNN